MKIALRVLFESRWGEGKEVAWAAPALSPHPSAWLSATAMVSFEG
jgi:hypothetical protein